MSQFFQFESDFVDSLRCIPMQVRYKLDTCGVKLKLHQWNKFGKSERQQLVEHPCDTDIEIAQYRDFLQALVRSHTGETAADLAIDTRPPWHEPQQIPASVAQKAAEISATIAIERWQQLTPLQRFALIKLSRSGHENNNFLPALK
jgi:hypothetical protein